MESLSQIRNFSIIAHIDHGKSTLADRMIEITHTVSKRDLREQILDDMDLERERGITIKAHPITMKYLAEDGQTYYFNLIDTPGHVDFSYEVSRSLAACEGALLIIDAAQGVEAQTVANSLLAMQQNLAVIPVINKIDLPNADVARVQTQIEDILTIAAEDCLMVSAKTGEGIGAIMEAIIGRIPPPTSEPSDGTRALVFDSVYNEYRGVFTYIRVVSGTIQPGQSIRMLMTNKKYEVKEVGWFTPKATARKSICAGEVGYLVANMKDAGEVDIGDTITLANQKDVEPLPGFEKIHPVVFAGIYPIDTSDYEKLVTSMEKLRLNDSSFWYQPESSVALGLGFRCGFLGLLHLEVIQERLRREFGIDIISTYPGVIYDVYLKNGEKIENDNPANLPDPTRIERIEEPMIKASIICLNEHIGDMMQLTMEKRGEVTTTESIDTQRVMLACILPLSEILIDFYDRLKSASRGYASFDYDHYGFKADNLVKMEILVHHEPVDAFSCIVHRDNAEARGRQICKSLKDAIPRQQFSVPVQAAIGRNVIARETIRAYKKDVTAKCYGGDISRKRKLLERQKEGKKKMKKVGKVNIPQDAFIAVFKSS